MLRWQKNIFNTCCVDFIFNTWTVGLFPEEITSIIALVFPFFLCRLFICQHQKLNKHLKTKVPEAWYEQEDKYNLFLLFFFSFSFLVLFFFYSTYSCHFILFILWCKTWVSSSDVRNAARCAFTVCLLWSRPPLASLL